MKLKVLALATLTCLSSIATAQNLKGYVGLGGGSAFSSVKDSNSGQTKSESASAVSFFGGVKFNENIAVEAEHISTGDIKLSGGKVKVSGYGVSAVTVPWIGSVPLGRLFSPILTIVWIVGITNAVNLLDNMDGLSAGTAAISAGVLAMPRPSSPWAAARTTSGCVEERPSRNLARSSA